MNAPNIQFRVKHAAPKKGNVFGGETYDRMREQLSRLVTAPYMQALKELWCDHPDHRAQETVITIDAADKSYEVTETCCPEYNEKIRQALAGVVEREPEH